MNVQSTATALFLSSAVARSPSTRQYLTESTSNTTDIVRISQAARDVFAASSSSSTPNNDKLVEARLAEIYDKAVASGNTAAAEGIAQIALIRQGGKWLVVPMERHTTRAPPRLRLPTSRNISATASLNPLAMRPPSSGR